MSSTWKPPALFSGEQSNSSVLFGEDSVLKVFRKITRGENPDITTHRVLTEAGSDHVAALYGWVEATTDDGAPIHLAMLQQFLRTASDGWETALASVRDLFSEADLHADEVGGDFASESARLGTALAEVHEQLRGAFGVDLVDADTWPRRWVSASTAPSKWFRSWPSIGTGSAAPTPPLPTSASSRRSASTAISTSARPSARSRAGSWSTSRASRPSHWPSGSSPTVRGAMWPGCCGPSTTRRTRWPDRCPRTTRRSSPSASTAPRSGPRATRPRSCPPTPALPPVRRPGTALPHEEGVLVAAYVADKTVYECVYEARNRPSWLPIPLAAAAKVGTP